MTKPTHVQLPADLDAAIAELSGLGQLLTATEWHRAAIIAAIVGPPTGRGYEAVPRSGHWSVSDLAGRRIVGLTKRDTIARYRDAWFTHADMPTPKLGASVRLPTMPWPPMRTGTDGYSSPKGAADTITRLVDKHGPDVIGQAIADDPDLAAAVRRGVRERDRQEQIEQDETIDRAGRNAEHHVARALDADAATMHLDAAAAELAEAILLRDLEGIEHPDAWHAALAKVQDYLDRVVTGDARWTDADDAFLADHGVRR